MSTTASGLKLLPGISSLINATNELIRVAASNDRPAFITGEMGTEKALAAKLIHQLSARSEEAMTKINVSWKLPPDLSQYFERCTGGTLIIHLQREFPVDMQYTIVEMTNHGCFADPMSGEMVESNARIILIANQELSEMGEKVPMLPELRDLLESQHVEIPPMRTRTEDIPALVRYAIRRARDTGRSQATSVDPAVLVLFRQWDWPGNTEDLLLVTAQAAIKSKGDVLTIDDLPTAFLQSLPVDLITQARAISAIEPAERGSRDNIGNSESSDQNRKFIPSPHGDGERELTNEEIQQADTRSIRVQRYDRKEPRRYQPPGPIPTPPQRREPKPDPELIPEPAYRKQQNTDEDTQEIKAGSADLTPEARAMSTRVLKLARRLNAQTSILQQQFSGPLDAGPNKDLLSRLMEEADDEEAMMSLEKELDRGLDLVLMLRRQMAMLNLRQQQSAETLMDLVQRLGTMSATGQVTTDFGDETAELAASLKAIDHIIKRVSEELPTVGKQIESTLMGNVTEREPSTSGLFRKPELKDIIDSQIDTRDEPKK